MGSALSRGDLIHNRFAVDSNCQPHLSILTITIHNTLLIHKLSTGKKLFSVWLDTRCPFHYNHGMETFKMTEAELIRKLGDLEAQYRALNGRFDFPALMESHAIMAYMQGIRTELEKRSIAATI
jgi:hypothetical protein